MSAILSADDLNDFISPGAACIKPVETLPAQRPEAADPATDPYEVTTEDRVAASEPAANAAPAEISLTDCLACSGCVTSAEAVLVSLQSHEEVLSTLRKHPSVSLREAAGGENPRDGKIFIASVSPQARASLAATYGVSEPEAGHMIEQLFMGEDGIKKSLHGSGFTWMMDTNTVREVCLAAGVQEVLETESPREPEHSSDHDRPKRPILASSCPGWICYAEKTHPHVLPHLSRLKSPQAMVGTMLKSVLSRQYDVPPDRIWHVAVMPCFDKKLEASREELTDVYWKPDAQQKRGVRDVDCVITAREIMMLADSCGTSVPNLPRTPVSGSDHDVFPDEVIGGFLFPHRQRESFGRRQREAAGSSGGYAYHIIQNFQQHLPGSSLKVERGRNADVIDYTLINEGRTIMKTGRHYGFRNIQNLVRKMKPQKQSRLPGSRPKGTPRANASTGAGAAGLGDYVYIEVMACPGGCTNGGGQVKVSDLAPSNAGTDKKPGPAEQKEWLKKTDEAYFSAESSSEDEEDGMDVDVPNRGDQRSDQVDQVLQHWSNITGIDLPKLILTSYRAVESDVGKDKKGSDMDRVAGLASSLGGGW